MRSSSDGRVAVPSPLRRFRASRAEDESSGPRCRRDRVGEHATRRLSGGQLEETAGHEGEGAEALRAGSGELPCLQSADLPQDGREGEALPRACEPSAEQGLDRVGRPFAPRRKAGVATDFAATDV
jgi:hypothetical protein